MDGFKSVDWGRLRNLYIDDKQLENCKVVSSREKILEVLPKNGICAELGVEHGIFSNKILDINKPKNYIGWYHVEKHLQVEHDVVEPIKVILSRLWINLKIIILIGFISIPTIQKQTNKESCL